MKTNIIAAAVAAFALAASAETKVERIFRAPKLVRGNTNIVQTDPIDHAEWIWSANAKDQQVLRFRKAFVSDGKSFELDVSADERFALMLDGKVIARGPDRGTVENWQYQSYRVTADAGEHLLEAVVWRHGWAAPLAQMTYKGGFIVKASGGYDEQLTTGKAKWLVGEVKGGGFRRGCKAGTFGVGAALSFTGNGPFAEIPASFADTVVVRGPAGAPTEFTWGARTDGWMLYPSQLPAQLERFSTPGSVRAVAHITDLDIDPVYTEADANDPLVMGIVREYETTGKLVVPAWTRLAIAWDLGRYQSAYPDFKAKGGKGARLRWGWAESLVGDCGDRDAKGQPILVKRDRAEVVGKKFDAFEDEFVFDGNTNAAFSTTWWRCGRWCQLKVETKGEPLELSGIGIIETRYPLELESEFTSPDDPSFGPVREICARAMQMCDHEMLFDCPFYEQQMYPGDTRVQLQVLSAMSPDDRMIKRAIEVYDFARRDDGTVPMNFPTRGTQESVTYTLCHLLMYGDYVMEHADAAWLKARLPGLRHEMSGLANYEDADGLLARLPGWSFMDWPEQYAGGCAPWSRASSGPNSEINLFYVLAFQAAAKVERAFGNGLLAQHWENRAAEVAAKTVATFWDEKRGALADDPKHEHFSEHSQCLALLADILKGDMRERCFKTLVEDKTLTQATVYFSYYLFETYFKFGRGDLFLKRLDLWRGYVKKNLTTTQEAPDGGKNGQFESRSDCHAWGAHPIWFMATGLAGIQSAAPFFAKVRIAPCPGDLKELHATYPHPQGWIKVDLTFADGKAKGRVETPVAGEFIFGGATVALKPGVNGL